MIDHRSNNNSVFSESNIFAVGIVLQLAYIAFSIIFFQERILYADTARFMFEIYGTKSFHFANRLIVFASQLLPVIGVHFGASLKTCMILYSFNVALVYTIGFFLLAKFFRNKQLVIALLLFQFLFLFRNHFLAISELQFGIVLLLICFAYLKQIHLQKKSFWKQPLFFVLLFIAMNAHPLMPLVFVGFTLLLSHQDVYLKNKDTLIFLAIGLVLFLISRLIFTNSYESGLIQQTKNAINGEQNYYLFRLLLSNLIRHYYLTLIIGVFAIIYLIKNYSAIKAILVFAIIFTQAAFIYLRFLKPSIILTFFEIYLSVGAILIFILAAQYILSLHAKQAKAAAIILLLLIGFQSYRVVQHSKFYADRIELYEGLLEQMEQQNIPKAILPFYKAPMSKINDSYTSPFETYIISNIDNRPNNDNFILCYWLSDSVNINQFSNYNNSLFRFNEKATIQDFPFADYPNLEFRDGSYQTFEPIY